MNHNPALTHAALVSQELARHQSNTDRANIIATAARTYIDNPKGLLPFFTGLVIAAYTQLDVALETARTKPITTRQLARTMRRNAGR